MINKYYSKNNKCKCGKKITNRATKCRKCYGLSLLGKNNPYYKDGRSLIKHYCSCGKRITYTSAICRQGLCKSCAHIGKKHSEETKRLMSYIALGRKHSLETRKKFLNRKITHGQWGKYKNIWMCSSWEILFAKFLDKNKITWEYEYRSFNLGNNNYIPDFYLPNLNKYFEIKGYWRVDAKKKYRTFKKLYSNINIRLIQAKEIYLIKKIMEVK